MLLYYKICPCCKIYSLGTNIESTGGVELVNGRKIVDH